MIKKIALMLLLALPLGLIAQDKLGFVKSQEIFRIMPDLADIEKKLADINERNNKELNGMLQELYKKTAEYQETMKGENVTATIKGGRQSEIAQMEERIGKFQQQSSQEFQTSQMELVTALRNKILKATEEVGAENNFTYIFDAEGIAYFSPAAVDVTPLVKKKLGLK